MNIKITLLAHDQPAIRILVNDMVYFDSVLHDPLTEIEFDAVLQDSNQLVIEHFGKKNEHTVCDEDGMHTHPARVCHSALMPHTLVA